MTEISQLPDNEDSENVSLPKVGYEIEVTVYM